MMHFFVSNILVGCTFRLSGCCSLRYFNRHFILCLWATEVVVSVLTLLVG